MSSAGRSDIGIVWANELRAASFAIERMRELTKAGVVGNELTNAERAALLACAGALGGLYDKPCITVLEADRADFEPRVTNVVAPGKAAEGGGK